MSGSGDPARQVTVVLRELREGDASAYERLVPLVNDELRAIARRLMRDQRVGHTLQPTALVNEALIRLLGQSGGEYDDRRHFLAIAAGCMRRVLVDHARTKGAEKRGGDWRRVSLHEELAPGGERELAVLDLHEALVRLAELDERQAQVVELRYFGGMTVEETAEHLGVSPSTVKLDWTAARLWLHRELADDAS
ncbi:MAG: sigma-70 family RNA polymerase sigma factor [Acidobacteriota bacterium]